MSNKSDLLTQSLIDYINDIKPYHTKFRDITSQIFFNDSMHVNMKEDYLIQSNFQNSWSADDIGGYLLSNVSDGAYTESLAFAGTGNGYLSFIFINPLSAIVENWSIVAIGSSTFSVTGSISGIKPNATVGVLYDNGIISFTITAGQLAFAVGDSFTFVIVGNQSYPIPATIFPRFSLTDRASYGQTPIGSDPSSLNLSDLPINTTTESHQHASQMIPVEVPIISTAQVGAIFQIVVDDADQYTYSFDPSTLNITINGTTWLGAYTKVGNVISINTVVTPILINTVDVLYLGTGRYATPYHQGSRVSVNGVAQTLGVNFTVDATRSFIQFLPTYHPATGTIIDINLFRSDRFFICWQDPFAYKTAQDSFTITAVAAPGIINAGSFVIGTTYSVTNIGSTNFTLIGGLNVIGTVFTATGIGAGSGSAATKIVLPGSFLTNTVYTIASIGTTNFTLIGAASNTVGLSFTATGPGTGTGIVVPAIQCNVSFTNTQPNTHKAILQNVSVSSFNSIGDVWTLTATGPWSFSVQQTTPFNPTITQAQFKSPYNDGILSFMLERTWTNYYSDPLNNDASYYTSYYIEQDLNTYLSYGKTQLGVSDGHDDSEFFPNLDIVTEHGVVTDPIAPLHKPVRFRPFGVIKRTVSADLLDDYVFEFDTIPPPYTYIEFKIEQEGQYNPWMNTTISEELFLSVTYQTTDAWHTAGQHEVLNLNNQLPVTVIRIIKCTLSVTVSGIVSGKVVYFTGVQSGIGSTNAIALANVDRVALAAQLPSILFDVNAVLLPAGNIYYSSGLPGFTGSRTFTSMANMQAAMLAAFPSLGSLTVYDASYLQQANGGFISYGMSISPPSIPPGIEYINAGWSYSPEGIIYDTLISIELAAQSYTALNPSIAVGSALYVAYQAYGITVDSTGHLTKTSNVAVFGGQWGNLGSNLPIADAIARDNTVYPGIITISLNSVSGTTASVHIVNTSMLNGTYDTTWLGSMGAVSVPATSIDTAAALHNYLNTGNVVVDAANAALLLSQMPASSYPTGSVTPSTAVYTIV